MNDTNANVPDDVAMNNAINNGADVMNTANGEVVVMNGGNTGVNSANANLINTQESESDPEPSSTSNNLFTAGLVIGIVSLIIGAIPFGGKTVGDATVEKMIARVGVAGTVIAGILTLVSGFVDGGSPSTGVLSGVGIFFFLGLTIFGLSFTLGTSP